MAIFCTHCGQDNSEASQFCSKCGQPLGAPMASGSPMAGSSTGGPMSGSSTMGGSMGASPMNPTGSPFPPPPNATFAGSNANAQTDGKAVASLVLGILALTVLSIIAGIPAVILGHMSRSNIKKSMGRLKGEGMALAGLIMGYLSLLIIPLLLIVLAIAIPNFLRARISANEAAAVSSLRTINVAAVAFQEGSENKSFPGDLRQMSEGGEDALIDQDLADGSKSGYGFLYTPQDSDGDQILEGYFVTATPLNPGSSGVRSFCTDQTGVIRSAPKDETCTAESEPL